MNRRNFFKYGTTISISTGFASLSIPGFASIPKPERLGGPKLKLSLNAYSFNDKLRKGEMDLFDLLDFCAEQGFDGVDATGYYFPGYPEVPEDNYIFEFKRKASILGIDISATGIRNDFSNPDIDQRKADIQLIENWIKAASKMGAPLIRVFAGKNIPQDISKKKVINWIIEDLKQCVAIGKENGVMIALQNHNDFIKNSDEVIEIMDGVDSKWFGLQLDIGSFGERDPYLEIQKVAQYAITWQIKEMVIINGQKVPTDYKKVVDIIKDADYRGYLPLETLGEGSEKRIPAMYNTLKKLIS